MTVTITSTGTSKKKDFTMIPNRVIESGLTPQALALFVIIAKHADNDSGEAWPSRKGMAALMGMSKASSVDRYVTELEEAGFISKAHQRKADGSQDKNRYRITAWTDHAEPPAEDGGSPSRGTGVVPHRGHELDPINYTQSTKDRSSVTVTGEPTAIPHDWHMNGLHANKGQALGLKVRPLGDIFKDWATYEGGQSSDWDKRFGKLLTIIEDGLSPDDRGFSGIAEYGNGDDLWWEEFLVTDQRNLQFQE